MAEITGPPVKPLHSLSVPTVRRVPSVNHTSTSHSHCLGFVAITTEHNADGIGGSRVKQLGHVEREVTRTKDDPVINPLAVDVEIPVAAGKMYWLRHRPAPG